MTATLQACEVSRALGTNQVLDRASLTLTAGRITALLGPSGSGKTTLLRVLAGLEDVDAGEVRAGNDVLTAPGRRVPPERRNVGVVFQDYALFPHLTALENVAFGLRGASRAAALSEARTLLDAAEIGAHADAYPHELSGGEQQRVALARALASRPSAVLMDEPFSNLDAGLRRALSRRTVDLLHESGAAVLIVTHDAEEAMLLADDLALMDRGRIIQTGPPETVYLRPVSARAAALTGDVNVWQGKVARGRLTTPFCAIETEMAEGADAVALVRPETLTLVAGNKACVTDRRLQGPYVVFEIEASGEVWRVRAPVDAPARPGDKVDIVADRRLVHIVAGEGDCESSC